MTALSVNLNKVALLRNQRDLDYPSVVEMARIAIDAGAAGITVHPRPDERHIRRSDVYDLAELLARDYAGRVEYNIEGYPAPEFLELIHAVRPDQVTLVPDAPDARTSDQGWDIAARGTFLKPIIEDLRRSGARIALFIDADPSVPPLAKAVGADRVELYTGPYNDAFGTAEGEAVLATYVETAQAVRAQGLGVNAGHDLNLDNLPRFLGAIPWVLEVSIGHAITADALKMGMADAVRAYLLALGLGQARKSA